MKKKKGKQTKLKGNNEFILICLLMKTKSKKFEKKKIHEFDNSPFLKVHSLKLKKLFEKFELKKKKKEKK